MCEYQFTHGGCPGCDDCDPGRPDQYPDPGDYGVSEPELRPGSPLDRALDQAIADAEADLLRGIEADWDYPREDMP